MRDIVNNSGMPDESDYPEQGELARYARNLMCQRGCPNYTFCGGVLLQQVNIAFLKINSKEDGEIENNEAYGKTIAKHEAGKLKKTCFTCNNSVDDVETESYGFADPREINEAAILIEELMTFLDEKDVELIMQHWFLGKTFPELSKEWGISEVTLRKRFERILRKLKNIMGDSS